MPTCALYRPLARRGHIFQRVYKHFLQARQLNSANGKPEAEVDEKGKEAAIPGSYRLHYNPTMYHHSKEETDDSGIKSDIEEDEQALVIFTPSFRQQKNYYSVSSSRHLSVTKNKLLDLAFDKASEDMAPSQSEHIGDPKPSDTTSDARAFQRCRSEYASMTLDLSTRPTAIPSKQAFQLLHKVTLLKSNMKATDVTEFIRELGHMHEGQTSLVRSDTRFIMLLRYSVENMSHFTHTQLLEVLQSFVWLGLPSTHSILGQFESELINRACQMSLYQLLLAADLWRCLGRQVPQFLKQLYDSINLFLRHIGVAELVQLLYIMGEGRYCPTYLVGPIEQILMCHLDKLYPEEVGAVCLGLFKSQTSLSKEAVNCLVDRAYSVLEEMSDFAMVNVFKLLRFSHLDHRAWLKAVAQELPRRAPRMDVMALMHVTLACSALHYRDDSILISVAERLPSVVQKCRSKDSSKLLWSFGTLGVLPSQYPQLYPSLVEALRQRKVEFQRYPEHLLTGLLGLAFVGQFPEDLLSLALSQEFVSKAVRNTQLDLRKDLLTLDGTVALEMSHWTGPRLSLRLREEVAAMLWKFAQSDVCQKPEVLEAERLLQDLLGGEQFVCKRMILPHTRTIDLEVHLDCTGKPLPVKSCLGTTSFPEESFSTSPSHKSLENVGVRLTEDLLAQLVNSKKTMDPLALSPQSSTPVLQIVEADEREGLFNVEMDLSNNLQRAMTKPSVLTYTHGELHRARVKLAIQVSNRNHYCYHSEQLLGLHAMKRRQLKLAGYRVVELKYWEWLPLLKRGQAEKRAYLHCKVYNSID